MTQKTKPIKKKTKKQKNIGPGSGLKLPGQTDTVTLIYKIDMQNSNIAS
jgi:hypothetical protein